MKCDTFPVIYKKRYNNESSGKIDDLYIFEI